MSRVNDMMMQWSACTVAMEADLDLTTLDLVSKSLIAKRFIRKQQPFTTESFKS
jgi:hypothetical protein